MNSYTEDNSQVPEMQQNLEILQELPFFSSFPIQALKLLAFTAERFLYDSDEILFEAGDDHDRAYLILHGQLTLSRDNEQRTVIRNFHDGDFTGIFALFHSTPSLFTLRTATPTRVLCLTREHFTKILEQFPETAMLSLRALTKEIHQWERKNLTKAENCCLRMAGVTNL